MNLRAYLNMWRGVQAENLFHRVSTIGLVVLCLLLSTGWLARHEVVVMLPPQLSKEGWVTNDGASEEVLTQWGLSIAELLGNVTPSTAGYLKKSIAPMLTPSIYQKAMTAIEDQVKEVQKEQITIRFSPTYAKIEGDSKIVVIGGELTTTGIRGNSQTELRTYELGLVVQNYRVLVDSINVYKGAPKNTH
jgi:conjugal transfer pilus assembly protein TraE